MSEGTTEQSADIAAKPTTAGSRFLVDDINVDREQLSVRSLGELLDLQRLAEEQDNQSSVRSLGELLSKDAGRARSGGQDSPGTRPRSKSAAESRLAAAALPTTEIVKRVVLLAVDNSEHSRTAFHCKFVPLLITAEPWVEQPSACSNQWSWVVCRSSLPYRVRGWVVETRWSCPDHTHLPTAVFACVQPQDRV